MEPFTHTINGRGETSEATFDVINPATGRAFAQCPDATGIQLDAAVIAARQAFYTWRELSFEERRRRPSLISGVKASGIRTSAMRASRQSR